MSSPPSEIPSTSSSSSPYFKRRYDGKKTTRREALEQRFGKNMAKSPKHSLAALSSMTSDVSAAPQIPDVGISASSDSGPRSPPRLTLKASSMKGIYPFDERISREVDDDRNQIKPTSTATTISAATSASIQQTKEDDKSGAMDDGGESRHEQEQEMVSKPQHLQEENSEMRYYRIIYRGVVALRSEPSIDSQRSGAYASYGEVIASSRELFAEDAIALGPSTPKRFPRLGSAVDSPLLSNVWESKDSPPKSLISHSSGSVSSLDTMRTSSTIRHSSQDKLTKIKAIRVDKVLTGGYAVDASDTIVEAYDKTPKRTNNTISQVSIVGPSPLPISDNHFTSQSVSSIEEGTQDTLDTTSNQKKYHGYILAQAKHVPICIPIEIPPKCEPGTFYYKVVSSTPLPIFTGPCIDAPKTMGMLIPGSVHEICLRVLESLNEPICFLRLTRRRGWVADRRLSAKPSGQSKYLTLMEEVTGERDADECSVSVMSIATSTVATPVSTARRRHRPPRRKRITKDTIDHAPLPRHVVGPSPSTLSQPRHQPSTSFEQTTTNHPHHDKGVMSPSSNVSLLSDESSLEHTHKSMTPDRSVARSAASSFTSQPTFILMRVNAPRGLKILDAPHFQVNNLIHGNHPGQSKVSSPMKDIAGQTGNQSIFQTMAGHHTTTLTSRIGNPAIFDSITKARKLPRGSVFEASRRMETSGAFSQGAGLIKLSDLSGWAIVPRQEELDEQYRTYSGSLTGIKEGEATRAYEEVGNAIVDERHSTVHLRIVSKGGISVSLYPSSSTISDDDTSPTSSAAGSSAVSGNVGQILSQDSSEVASSIGSSFLDSMFRTPKKRDTDHFSTDRSQFSKVHTAEKVQVSTVIPCGMIVEVERWVDTTDFDQHPHKNEFARLCGGQGWIPRYVNGKAVAEIISPPEHRFGSFWFRVQKKEGIKVGLGPSRRAPSIKSDDGVYFRFECGEFLRSSEIVTFFRRNAPSECFAKLYRNRHARLHTGHGEVRSLASLTVQAEWVQVFGSEELYLEECGTEPNIERHRQGWRYNVVLDARVQVRKGPSFEAEVNGVILLGGESVLINERVTAPDDTISWLRLRDGQGWVHNVGREGEALMIPHSLRHRKGGPGRPSKPGRDGHDDIAYNTIIARLFHSDLPDDSNNSRDAWTGRR